MERFPEEFSDLLSPLGRRFLEGEEAPPADLTREEEHFFVLPDVLDSARSEACLRILTRDFEGKLGPIQARIPPEWIRDMTRNFADTFGKSMDVDSFIFSDPDSELFRVAEANGLLAMMRSASLRQFGEAVTGLELEGGWGSQVICYRHGHYVGPHNDHFPEYEWARDGYVDVQLMLANDAVAHQWFVHEKDGLLSQSWDINLTGAVSVFRQPFWHYTTPLLGKGGREAQARRWLIGQVFRITARPPAVTVPRAGEDRAPAEPDPRPRIEVPAARDRDGYRPALVLDRDLRLSESLLWEWQRRFYDEHGVGAWRDGIVPSQVTSGSFLAAAYARVVRAFLLDGRRAGIDPGRPLSIVELGAGSGRFAHVFLRSLLDRLPDDAPPIRYVLTDFTKRNLEAWAAQPLLRQHVAAGRVDFAIFDARARGPIRLGISGAELTAASVENPLVVLANYVFDSVEHDVFRVEDGCLYEGRVTLASTEAREPDPTDPAIVDRCEISFDYRRVGDDVYDDPAWNRILESYRERLDPATFLFPVGALRALGRLEELARGRLLVLATDKGHLSPDEFMRNGDPSIAVHGSISLMVNFDALAAYCVERGHFARLTPPLTSRLATCALAFGFRGEEIPETELAFREALGQFGPLERHELVERWADEDAELPLERVLALLRMTDDDPFVFCRLAEHLRRSADALSDTLATEVTETVARVWANHFPIGGEPDVAFEIATVLQLIGRPAEAISYYERSIDLQGEHFTTAHNLGLCLVELGRPDRALEAFTTAAALNPDYEPALEWRDRLRRAAIAG